MDWWILRFGTTTSPAWSEQTFWRKRKTSLEAPLWFFSFLNEQSFNLVLKNRDQKLGCSRQGFSRAWPWRKMRKHRSYLLDGMCLLIRFSNAVRLCTKTLSGVQTFLVLLREFYGHTGECHSSWNKTHTLPVVTVGEILLILYSMRQE